LRKMGGARLHEPKKRARQAKPGKQMFWLWYEYLWSLDQQGWLAIYVIGFVLYDC